MDAEESVRKEPVPDMVEQPFLLIRPYGIDINPGTRGKCFQGFGALHPEGRVQPMDLPCTAYNQQAEWIGVKDLYVRFHSGQALVR